MEGGTWSVNDRMVDDCIKRPMRQHPCNLGAPIAMEIAKAAGVRAFVVDPPCVDEFDEVAKITGLPEIRRDSLAHALNLKAIARQAARDLGRRYEDSNLVVVHLGGGISVSAHRHGRMVDSNDATAAGPFAPERAGDLPTVALVNLCFSGTYTRKEILGMLVGKGGLVAHLGTNSAIEVEKRIRLGDTNAEMVYRAMAYQVAKWIGSMAVVLDGNVDAIVIGGGLAHSNLFVGWVKEKVRFLAPVMVYPGSDEMRALVYGALRVLRGEETAKEYT